RAAGNARRSGAGPEAPPRSPRGRGSGGPQRLQFGRAHSARRATGGGDRRRASARRTGRGPSARRTDLLMKGHGFETCGEGGAEGGMTRRRGEGRRRMGSGAHEDIAFAVFLPALLGIGGSAAGSAAWT